MAGNETLSFFGIELGVDGSKLEKGLQAIERRALQHADRIEKRLNQAFAKNTGVKAMNNIFNQIDKRATQSARHIRREYDKVWSGMNGQARAGFRGVEAEGSAVARRLRAEMRDIWNIPRGGRPAGGGSSTPRPRPAHDTEAQLAARQARLQGFIARQQESAQMARWSVRDPERYQRRTAELNAIRDRHLPTGDLSSAVNDVRRSMFAHRAELASLTNATRNTVGNMSAFGSGLLGMVGKLYAAGKMIDLFMFTVHAGIARQNSENQFSSAFGKNTEGMRSQILEIANMYGLQTNEALSSAAQLRQTIPEKSVGNPQLAGFFKEEAVLQHVQGLTPDKINRLNNALSQMMSAGKVMGGDLNQVKDALSSYVQLVSKGAGRDISRKEMLGMDAKQFFDYLHKGMQIANEEQNAYVKAAEAAQAVLTRFDNAKQESGNQFFMGMEKGWSELVGSLTNLMQALFPEFRGMGSGIGDIADAIATFINGCAHGIDKLNSFVLKMMAMFDDADKSTQQSVKSITDAIVGIFETVLAAIAVKLGMNRIADIWNLAKAGRAMLAGEAATTAATTAATATEAATAATAAEAVAAPAVAATTAETAAVVTPEIAAALPEIVAMASNPVGWLVAGAGAIGYLASTQKQNAWLADYDKNRTKPGSYNYGQPQGVPEKGVALERSTSGYNYGQKQPQQQQQEWKGELHIKVDQNGQIVDQRIMQLNKDQQERIVINGSSLPGAAGENAGFNPTSLLRRPPVAPSATR